MRFSDEQYNFLKVKFEKVVSPDEENYVNKLVLREGSLQVLRLIQDHIDSYKREALNGLRNNTKA